MGTLIQTFTFDRNTFRKTNEESANLVKLHIEKVQNSEQLEKIDKNIIGALASYMGIFKKDSGKYILTGVGNVFLGLYATNKADSWRWLVARSLWKFVVPNGTLCKVNDVAKSQNTTFSFFCLIVQLLTHLSANQQDGRYLYFEEMCSLLAEDSNWNRSAQNLYEVLLDSRSKGEGGFKSKRSFLDDLENSLIGKSEFEIPRDNFNGLFLKAFEQTGFFEFKFDSGRAVAIALNPYLDPVLQRRIRFILDHPPAWAGDNWSDYLDINEEDLPKEVTKGKVEENLKALWPTKDLTQLLAAAVSQFSESNMTVNTADVLRFAASLMSKRFLILTGLAGSGKTKLAQAFGRWITPKFEACDVFTPGVVIPSDRIEYIVGNADSLSVELWNSKNEEEAKKVTLARELIAEWANFIRDNSIPITMSARDIREAVKKNSQFSDQLHSFETHLKAAAFALLAGEELVGAKCYEVVAIGADWTSNENVLGYPDGLQADCYVTRPALDLILHAFAHPTIPHFLILDEMNLSHVERYFADILSSIESEEGLNLYSGDINQRKNWRKSPNGIVIPPVLKKLPENIFIIGTVNVDETTYMFSPKVLDRANVIEFRMDDNELDSFLTAQSRPDLLSLDGKGALFGTIFVEAAQATVTVPLNVKESYKSEMLTFFRVLKSHSAEFGYRTAYEAARFVFFYQQLSNPPADDISWFFDAFDCVIFQKMLPKLHGSRSKLGPMLKKLWFLCVNSPEARGIDAYRAAEESMSVPNMDVLSGAHYPMSALKICQMWKLIMDNGFASFAEA